MRRLTPIVYASCCSLGLLAFQIAGCEPPPFKSDGTSTSSSTGTGGGAGGGGEEIREPQGTSVIISVLDAQRMRIASPWVTTANNASRQANEFGMILFENLSPGRFSARVEQSGYASASVAVDLPEGAHGGIESRLIRHPPRLNFDAAAGAKLDQDSVHITIPANAVVDANGMPFTGIVEATIVPLNPDTNLDNVPAPLEGMDAKGAEVELGAVFMVEVSLWNGAERLHLAPGKQIALELVLPDSSASKLNLGQSIPAWRLDLDAGIWREEGEGKVQASVAQPGKLAWTAQVTRLAWWNASLPWKEKHCFRVRVVEKDGQAVPHQTIVAASAIYHGVTMSKVSNAAGEACLDIKKDGATRIFLDHSNLDYNGIGLVTFQDVVGAGAASSCNAAEPACAEVTIVSNYALDCIPGQSKQCTYPGPEGTENIGFCKAGRKWCTSGRWPIFGGCAGEVVPGVEDCNAPGDEDCDGLENEEGNNCTCKPGQTAVCYSGSTGTLGKGICATGTRSCDQGIFGACMGEVLPAAETCSTPDIDDNCDGITDCRGFALWSKQFGDPGSVYGSEMAVDSADNLVLTGQISDSVDFGNGPLVGTGLGDAYLAKFDANGNALWSKTFPNGGSQEPYFIEIDNNDNLVLLGGFQGTVDFGGGPLTQMMSPEMGFDAFLAKFHADGNHVWSKQFAAPGARFAYVVRTDSAGNVVLAGSFKGTVDFGGGPLVSAGVDAFVLKLDPNGNHLWSRHFAGTEPILPSTFAIGKNGNIILSGTFSGIVDFGNGPLVEGDVMEPFVTTDLFALVLDSNGNPVWSKSFYLYNPGNTHAAAMDADGNVILVGDFYSGVDFGGGMLITEHGDDVFVAKLDANGNHLWSHRYGGDSSDHTREVRIDAKGNIVVLGRFAWTADFGGGSLSSAGADDVFAVKLDANGNHLWSRRFGDDESQFPTAMSIDSGDHVLVAGSFDGTIDFGTGPLVNKVGKDVFLTKLAP